MESDGLHIAEAEEKVAATAGQVYMGEQARHASHYPNGPARIAWG